MSLTAMKNNSIFFISLALAALGIFSLFGVRPYLMELYLTGPREVDFVNGYIYPYDAHGVTVYFSLRQVLFINTSMVFGVLSLVSSGVLLSKCPPHPRGSEYR